MGIFRQFPYSNFHEMNLDEMIKLMRELQEEWDATKAEWASYKDFIDNYFANLDVTQEVLNAMRVLAGDGTLNQIIDPVIITETASWLEAHITSTSGITVIDDSLSVEGAAADAKATGDAINAIKSDLDYSRTRASFLPQHAITDFTNQIVSGYWGNNYIYKAGYITSITVKTITQGDVVLAFLDLNNKCFKKITVQNVNGVQDIAINAIIPNDFILLINSNATLGYASWSTGVTSYRITSSIEVGDIVTLTANGTYDMAVVVNYSTVAENLSVLDNLPNDLDYSKTRASFTPQHAITDFTSPIASGYWGNNFIYKAGYVTSITVKTLTQGDVVLAFLDLTNRCFKKVTAQSVNGIQDITINAFIPNDFILLINSNATIGFASWSSRLTSYRVTSSIEVGNIVNLTANGAYHMAVVVNYSTIAGNLNLLNTKAFGNRNKMFVFGDSLTACYPTYSNALKWQTEVGRTLGLEITSGEASGNGYLYSTGSANAKTIALATDFTKYDYTVSFWGTNDYGNDANLGTFNDIYVENAWNTSFYAAVAYVVRTIFASSKKVVPILVTPINRTDRGTVDTKYAYNAPNNTGATLSDYCQAIVDVANHYGIPYIDNRNSAFNMYSCLSWLSDGLHPTEDGYKMLGQWLTAQLSKFVSPYHGEY